MSLTETFVDIATTPWMAASAAFATVTSYLHAGPVVDFVVAMSTQWFGPLAIGASTLAPNLEWVPTDAAMSVFVGVAAVVFVTRVHSTIEWMRDKYG